MKHAAGMAFGLVWLTSFSVAGVSAGDQQGTPLRASADQRAPFPPSRAKAPQHVSGNPAVTPADPTRSNFDQLGEGRPTGSSVRPGRANGTQHERRQSSAGPAAERTQNAVSLVEVTRPVVAYARRIAGTPCTHTITLRDDYGDGWNGGSVDIYVNGFVVLQGVTLASGTGPASATFDAVGGDTISTVWAAGDFAEEASYCIYDGLGAELGCDGQGGFEPTGITVAGFCDGLGACCDPATGVCSNGVMGSVCATTGLWTYAVDCSELPFPCGNPGACCTDTTGDCTETLELDCDGRFRVGETCATAVFEPACGETHTCRHSITLDTDSRFGWGSSFIDVYVNGAIVLTGVTMQDLYGPETVYFDAGDEDEISTVWTAVSGGAGPVFYCINDGAGNTLGCDGLGGTVPGGITVSGACIGSGACCDPFNGTCSNGVEVWNCQPPYQYTDSTECANLPVPCGNPGACCDDASGGCIEDFEINCAGRFEPGATCADSPFVPACGSYDSCDVLIAPALNSSEYATTDFPQRLSTLTLSSTDYFDATNGTPSLALLLNYDMVITFVNDHLQNRFLMGDVLADYVDAGGRVIIGNYSDYTAGAYTWLDGRIMEDYNPAQVDESFWGNWYSGDGEDCMFDDVEPYYTLPHDNIIGSNGPSVIDAATYDDGSAVAAFRLDRSVYYVAGHMGGYIAFAQSDRQSWAEMTRNICYCEPDPVVGACCDPFDGTCSDGVDVSACMPPMQFHPNTTCGALDEPCGNPGACCDDTTGTCTIAFEKNCTGRFAAGATCADAGFDPPCGVTGTCDVLYAPTAFDSGLFRSALSFHTVSDTDFLNARFSTPTLSQLINYEAVITWVDYPYADPVAMGDVLADYVEAGGRVILGLWASPGGQYNFLAGRLMDEYSPVEMFDDTLGGGANFSGGEDCIHDGIEAYGNGVIDHIVDIKPGATFDGTYVGSADGWPAVAYRYDRKVFYVAGFAAQREAYGDWAELMANICRCPRPEQFGACCDPLNGTCADDVEVLDCQPPLQWTENTLCADLSPLCGNPGACCQDINGDGTCSNTVQAQCAERFLPGADCATASFDPPCGTYEPCEHQIELQTEWEFGWNEASFDLHVGGLPRLQGVTLAEGVTVATVPFYAEDGEPITTTWNQGRFEGAWDFLHSYCIEGLDGSILGCDGEFGSQVDPTGITVTGDCDPVVCGNGLCQIAGGESCANCPADCGTCRCVQQPSLNGLAYLSDLDCQLCSGGGLQVLADQFRLFELTNVAQVRFEGNYAPNNLPVASDQFTVLIRSDDGAFPGDVLFQVGPIAGTRTALGAGVFEHVVALDVKLPAGQYWIQIHNNTVGSDETWGWYDASGDEPFGGPGVAASTSVPESWEYFSGIELAFELTCSPVSIPGDLDGDGDVDYDDHAIFVGCMDGPNVAFQAGCAGADLDDDGDVDLGDLALFFRVFGFSSF